MAEGGAGAGRPRRARNLYCQVCQDVFRHPKLLVCFHSFCQECLQNLARDHGPDRFPCPTCHRDIPLPPEGVQGLADNVFFAEEDLERERLRDAELLCPVHVDEVLVLFCTEPQCDTAICQLCGLTTHSQHRMEILSEVANRDRGNLVPELRRLEFCIENVSTMSHMAQSNLRAAREKATVLRELIYSQHRIMVARATRLRDRVLEGLADVSRSVEGELGDDVQQSEDALDFLLGLQRRVINSINGNLNDVRVTEVYKEMRSGRGSHARLAAFTENRPAESPRPGLFSFTGNLKASLEKDVLLFLGSPVKLMVPNRETSDILRPFYSCGNDGFVQEIHSILRTEDGNLHVAYGGKPPLFDQEKVVHLDSEGVKLREHHVQRRISFDKSYTEFTYAPIPADFFHDLQANSNGEYRIKTSPFLPEGKTTIQRKMRNAPNARPVDFEINAACRPHGFDANADGSLFVLINEEDAVTEPEPEHFAGHRRERRGAAERRESRRSVVRTVRLYRRNFSDPAATYRPPLQHFFPTAVTFWRTAGGQELLLVADLMNDCVHVVNVVMAEFHFVRFLQASGRGDLVRPTALDVDRTGIIWIGCETGLLLHCRPAGNAGLPDPDPDQDPQQIDGEAQV